jgi:hypothetical protein
MHRRVGLGVFGSETGPRTQRSRGPEPTDVTDLGDQDCGHGRADPVDRLDRPIPPITAQPLTDVGLEHGDLTVKDLDQIA